MPDQPPRLLDPLSSFTGSLANRVFLSLRNAIFSQIYCPGEILRKGEVCDLLGVSRSPVSEAVTRLATEGLVRIQPQAGTFVSRFSMAEIREGAFMREALELAAVERVARLINGQQLELLKQNLGLQQELATRQDAQGFFQADRAMHALILSFTGFDRLAPLAEQSWVQVDRARIMHLPSPGRVQETLSEHHDIVDALSDRDPARARAVTRHHLTQLIKYLEPMEKSHPELFEPSG